jgi:tRNA pseudouridine38-40 synthase
MSPVDPLGDVLSRDSECLPGDSPLLASREPVAAGAELTSPPQRCFRLTLAYDGTNYFGWQRQPRHPSVQAAVEKAICAVTGDQKMHAWASSRTDTGVHALGQSAVFTSALWPAPADRLPLAINTKLPGDISVRDAVEVPLRFNPLRLSTGKRYRYQVYSARKPDPIGARTQWWVPQLMELPPMQAAAQLIVGQHDFAAFQTTGSPRSTTIREVRELTIEAAEHMDGIRFTIEVEASGFLYNMVRNIAGTLVQIGVGRKPPEWITEVLASRDRREAGQTAPACGLFLLEVKY